MIRLLFITSAVALILTACAGSPQKNRPTPEGQLTIMGPGLQFNLDAPPKDWIIATDDANQGPSPTSPPLSTVFHDGVWTLEIRSGPVRSIAIRKVDAMLLATPYLSWIWNLSDHGQGIHPVRLVVGFNGGASDGTRSGLLGDGLPAHDRALALVWGDTALRRGTLSLPPAGRPFEAPVYTVRGGRENTRKWWADTVDLSALYARAWPSDTLRTSRITFIGIAAAPRTPAVRGRVAEIRLSH